MKNNNEFDDEILDDEIFDDDIFEEVDKKSTVIKLIIAVCVLLIIVIALVISVLSGRKNKSPEVIQEDIVDYSLIEEPIPSPAYENQEEIYDKNEEEPTPLPTFEPSPEPDVEQTPDLADNVGPIMEDKGKKDYSKIKFDTKRNLKEMESYFAEGNEEALWDLSHLDRYIAMSYSFRNTTDYGYYGDVDSDGKPDGKGIAVYADNQYYYGDWKHGLRAGEGTWFHYHIHNVDASKDYISYIQFNGTFNNDMPNGDGQLHYSFVYENLIPDTVYINNYIGRFKDCYIDGDIYCTSIDNKGNCAEWQGNASAGTFEYMSESRDSKKRGPVLMNIANPDYYYWLNASQNKNIGVSSYISEYLR